MSERFVGSFRARFCQELDVEHFGTEKNCRVWQITKLVLKLGDEAVRVASNADAVFDVGCSSRHPDVEAEP